ncbi:MAG: tyrosine-type recombinase/integrase [Ktedonobacteraceae bacterium]
MSRERYGQGSVYERKDGRYSGYIMLENHKRKYFYGKTKKEVLDHIKKALREQEQGALVPASKQTVKQFLEYWLEEVHKQKIKQSSYIKYRKALNYHILPALGHIHLQKLTAEHIDTFYAKLLKQGKSPKSIKDIHGIVHVALQYAVKRKRLSKNVANDIDLPRMERYSSHVLDKDQARRLLEVAKGSRLETLLIVALATGMRRGELLALRWSDVHFDIRSLHVQRTVDRVKNVGYVESEPKTKRSRRTIMLPQFVIDALMRHRMQQVEVSLQAENLWVDRDLVFCNMVGDFLYPDNVSADFKKLVGKAGLPPMRFHDLRHSAATILLAMGVHPKVVQEILGHTQISITMDVYSHMLPSMQREAMEGLNNLFGNEK